MSASLKPNVNLVEYRGASGNDCQLNFVSQIEHGEQTFAYNMFSPYRITTGASLFQKIHTDSGNLLMYTNN